MSSQTVVCALHPCYSTRHENGTWGGCIQKALLVEPQVVKRKTVWDSLLGLADLRKLIQVIRGQQNKLLLSCKRKESKVVCICNAKQWWHSISESHVAPSLCSICKGTMSIGNLVSSFKAGNAVWLLCCIWNLKHLFLHRGAKGYNLWSSGGQRQMKVSQNNSFTVVWLQMCRACRWVHGCVSIKRRGGKCAMNMQVLPWHH